MDIMVTTTVLPMDTSHKEELAAILALLATKVVMVASLAASLLIYSITISNLILSIVMIKTIVSLLNESPDIEDLWDTRTYKHLVQFSSLLRYTSVQSR